MKIKYSGGCIAIGGEIVRYGKLVIASFIDEVERLDFSSPN